MSQTRRPSVLVAVADADTRASISAISVEMGFSTISVGTDTAAWKALRGFSAEIVIVDFMSRTIDGSQLCEQVREIAADQCVVAALIDCDRTSDLRRALAAGADDVIIAPVVSAESIGTRLLILERLVQARRTQQVAELELARLRWLASVGQSALTFQHDINNPLTALYAHLDMLRFNGAIQPDDEQDLAGAVEQVHRIENVVRQLASTSGMPADRPARRNTQPRFPSIEYTVRS
jgi:DNA-binding response OmpR family regulator